MRKSKVSKLISSLTKTGIWEHNYDKNLLEWDEEMFQIYEITKSDFEVDFGKWAQIVHPDDIDRVRKSYSNAVETEGEYQLTFRIITPSGNLKHIKASAIQIETNDDGDRIIVGANQDVTELMQAQQERQDLINTLHESQETAKIGSWQHDLITGKTFNDAATKRICGLPPDYDLQAEEGLSFYKEGYSRDKINEVFSLILKEGTPYDIELEMVTKQGKEIWVRAIGKPVYNEEGKIVKVQGVFQDISKQKEKELELLKRNLDLQMLTERLSIQNQKLNDFAHIASHNLRAPVANLMMLKDLFLEEKDQAELQELLQLAATSTEKLNDTLDHLMEALVIQNSHRSQEEWVSLSTILENLKVRLGHLMKSAEASLEVDLEVESLRGQPLYLDSIFLNLISNALKYRHPKRKPVIEVRSFIQEEELIIEVSDNGLGIDLKRHAGSIFGFHKTFHKNPQARGVGLFMVKTQVESMGGNITVNSQVNEGSTFMLSFNSEITRKA